VTVPPRQATPAYLQISAILTHLQGKDALREVCRFLRAEFPHYRWVGVYALRGETLKLVAWEGDQPTEHVEIPIGRGVCGRAARERRTVIVDDVRADPEYLACFLETRAEIVVPVMDGATVLGEIDIDGTAVKAFDASDAVLLQKIAAKLVAPLGDVLRASSGAAPSPAAPP
jgi:L-methionine (R)-S-oxide reductase